MPGGPGGNHFVCTLGELLMGMHCSLEEGKSVQRKEIGGEGFLIVVCTQGGFLMCTGWLRRHGGKD